MEKKMANNLSNFNPFNEISRFEPLRNLDEFFNNYRLSSPWSSWEPEPRIKIHVSETEDAYLVKADAPGVPKEDIKVTVEGNFVTIEFEVKKENEQQDEGKTVRSERYYADTKPQFRTGAGCGRNQGAEATYKDGVLELKLPKKPGSGTHPADDQLISVQRLEDTGNTPFPSSSTRLACFGFAKSEHSPCRPLATNPIRRPLSSFRHFFCYDLNIK